MYTFMNNPSKNFSNIEYTGVVPLILQCTSRRSMCCWVEEPSFLSVNDPIPSVSVFMEGHTTTGSSQEKNTVINSILQHKILTECSRENIFHADFRYILSKFKCRYMEIF